VSQIGLRSMV